MLSKHFEICLIVSELSQILHMPLWVSLILLHVSTICSPFSSWLITSNFPSILIIFHWFFTWLALGDIHLHFSLMFVRISSAEEESKWAVWLFHQWIQTIHMTNGVTVTSLCASLLLKIRVAVDCLCQIALNRKLSPKFEKWCKF
jgi:hypothetical protein